MVTYPFVLEKGYPHTLPRCGEGVGIQSVQQQPSILVVSPIREIPDIGRFSRSRGKTSQVAHATTSNGFTGVRVDG